MTARPFSRPNRLLRAQLLQHGHPKRAKARPSIPGTRMPLSQFSSTSLLLLKRTQTFMQLSFLMTLLQMNLFTTSSVTAAATSQFLTGTTLLLCLTTILCLRTRTFPALTYSLPLLHFTQAIDSRSATMATGLARQVSALWLVQLLTLKAITLTLPTP